MPRFFCTKDPRHRVFPYDSLESLTLAPVTGKTGEGVLLISLNAQLAKAGSDYRWGYCWACGEWVQASRRTRDQVMRDYLQRQGVSFRVEGRGIRERIEELQDRIDQKRQPPRRGS